MRIKYGKFFGFFLTFFLVFLSVFFTKCSKKEKDTIKIGVSVSNFEDRFLSYVKSGMEEYQKGLGDKVDVIYLDADEDFQKQVQQVSYFLENKVDALVVVPVNTAYTSEMTQMAKKEKIPIVYVNRYPDEFLNQDLSENVYYVGSKEKAAGIIQMEYLAKKLKGKGDIAILMGNPNTRATFERSTGVEETAEKYPEINIVDKSFGRWVGPLAESIVEGWLSSGVEFDAIVSNNDEMAIGAIRTLERYGKLDEVMVVGIDATNEGLIELKAGKLTATVFQDSKSQGKIALETAYRLSQGDLIKNIRWIPFKLITQDNFGEIE